MFLFLFFFARNPNPSDLFFHVEGIWREADRCGVLVFYLNPVKLGKT